MLIPEDQYRKILSLIPIPCVDLLVVDRVRRVLLLKRRNEPAKGLWWVPGGRVHFDELRIAAAHRKLQEECGLRPQASPVELCTEDLILPNGDGSRSHVICTVFRFDVDGGSQVVLDEQSEAADWRTIEAWSETDLHPYVSKLVGFLKTN
jgi:ADP-ribose pyrophosphatase YjhB (NUDIX family)